MKKLAILLLLTASAFAQPVPPAVQYVASAPSGSCTNGATMQLVIPTGVLYSCQSGSWAAISGSGTFTTLSQDATSTATGGTTEVVGLLTHLLPSLTTGYLNWTGSAWVLSAPFTLTTTGSSGAATFTSGTLNIPQYSGGGVSSFTGDGTIITNSASTGAVTATIAGTSGGIPYFSSGTGWASSGALTHYGVVYGGGAAGSPVATAADTTTTHALFATATAPAFRAIASGDIPTLNQNTTGSAGSVANALTMNNGGSGAASGSTFNGSAAVTLSYNTLGAAPLASPTFTGTVTIPSGLTLSGITGSTQCLDVNSSGVVSGTGSACGSGGSTSWSSITNPSTNLALTMGSDTSTFTYGATTGSSDLYKLTDTASNTGTGIMFHATTASSSTEVPWQADANGVGWQVNDAGAMASVGSTASGEISLTGSSSGTANITVQAAAGTPTVTLGTSSGTPAVTASAPLAISTTTGNITITGAAGQVLAGSTPAFTATPTLGASGTLGSLTLGNATSGLLTVQPATGAITSYTIDLPVAQPAGSNTFLSCTAANPAVCTWAAGGGGGGTAESAISAPTTTNTITETAAGDWTARAGVETAALTAPWSFVNTNSTNNNTSIGLLAGAAGTSTGGIGELLYNVSGTSLLSAYSGGSVTSNAYTAGTLESQIDSTGSIFSNGTVNISGYADGTTFATTNGSCASTTTTNCTIAAGTNLNPDGGWAVFGVTDGGSNEYVCYTSASSTSIVFGQKYPACSSTGRGSFGSSATTFGTGTHIANVNFSQLAGSGNVPYMYMLQSGATFWGRATAGFPSSDNTSNNIYQVPYTVFGNGIAFGTSGNSGGIKNNGTGVQDIAANGNATFLANGNSPSRNVATQSISSTGTFATNATAITAAVTPTYPTNSSAASNTVQGQLESDCEIIYQQATAAAANQFGVKPSAAITALTVIEEDYNGTTVTSSSPTVITSATVTATSPTVTPAATGTNYWSHLRLIMNPGTTNSPTVQLYANSGSGSDAITIAQSSGCTSWH